MAGAIIEITPKACSKKGLSSESNYFIKAVNCTPAALKARLKSFDFEEVRSQCAAIPTISKPDIVKLYTAQIAAATAVDPAVAVQGEDAPIMLTLPQRGAAEGAHAAVSQEPRPAALEQPVTQAGSDTAPDHDLGSEHDAAHSDGLIVPDTPDAALEKAGIKLPAEQAIGQLPANDAASHDAGFRSAVRDYKRRALKLLHISRSSLR